MSAARRILIVLTFLFVPGVVSAQKLTPGSWTGTLTPPDGPTMNVTFDVRVSGDTTRITMKAEGNEAVFYDIKVEATRLLFTFDVGATVQCTLLLREDKSYRGDCSDSAGGKGVIVMIPPKSGEPNLRL